MYIAQKLKNIQASLLILLHLQPVKMVHFYVRVGLVPITNYEVMRVRK